MTGQWVPDPKTPSGFRWDEAAPDPDVTVTELLPVVPPLPVPAPWVAVDPLARTAGEQDHSDPWRYAGPVAEPPRNPS
jgi:hypothetical protein